MKLGQFMVLVFDVSVTLKIASCCFGMPLSSKICHAAAVSGCQVDSRWSCCVVIPGSSIDNYQGPEKKREKGACSLRRREKDRKKKNGGSLGAYVWHAICSHHVSPLR